MADSGIPQMMQAAQYHQKDNACHINTILVPTPKPFELLVKTLCSSLCRSDLMNFESDELGLKPTDPDAPPITMGHEASGVVVAVGAKCIGFSVGDEVGFLPSTNVCFDCEACQVHQMWCETHGGCKMPGHGCDGFFQEYIAVHYRNTLVLPAGLSAVEAALLFCAGVTSYHGISDLGLPAGSWVAVIGCGGLGHLGIQYAAAKGYQVIGLDIVEEQLQEARTCGATHVFNTQSDPDYIAKIKSLTSGGCDAVVNYTNSKRSYDNAPKVLRTNGILNVVGHPQEQLTFSSIDIALHKFRIYGASNSVPSKLQECVEFSVKHGIKPHVKFYRGLESIHEMMRLMEEGKVRGRLAIRFD